MRRLAKDLGTSPAVRPAGVAQALIDAADSATACRHRRLGQVFEGAPWNADTAVQVGERGHDDHRQQR